MFNHKTCTRCGQIKSFDEFNKCASKKDGLRSHCRQCVRDSYYSKIDEIRAKDRDYYQANKEKVLAQNKKYAQNNPEKIKEIKKRYRNKNKTKIAEINKKWEQSNPEKSRNKVNKRRAIRKNLKTFLVTDKELKRLYRSLCFFCGKPADTIEHVIPISRGGDHGIGNLLPACRSCNSSKNNKTIMEWKKVRGW